MFGIGWAELVVVGIVALVVVGPEKLPEAARAAGKLYGYIYRTLAEARESVRAEVNLAALDSRKAPETAQSAGPDEPAEDDRGPGQRPPQEGA